jgi:hypothetical protein
MARLSNEELERLLKENAAIAEESEEQLKALAAQLPGGSAENYITTLIDFLASEYGWGLDQIAGLDNTQMMAFVEQALARRAVGSRDTWEAESAQAVDLDQIAALMKLKKRTMENYKRRKEDRLPTPDYPGGGGRKDRWEWSTIQPWLERNATVPIPKDFPDAYRKR